MKRNTMDICSQRIERRGNTQTHRSADIREKIRSYYEEG